MQTSLFVNDRDALCRASRYYKQGSFHFVKNHQILKTGLFKASPKGENVPLSSFYEKFSLSPDVSLNKFRFEKLDRERGRPDRDWK